MHLWAALEKGLKPTAEHISKYNISQEYGYMFWVPFQLRQFICDVCILWIVIFIDMAKSNHDLNNKIVTQ